MESILTEPRHIGHTSWNLQGLAFTSIIGFDRLDLLIALGFLHGLFCDLLTSSGCLGSGLLGGRCCFLGRLLYL